jgi:ankyrin repeat protein
VIVKVLVSPASVANVSIQWQHGAEIEPRDSDLNTPLHWAAMFDRMSIAHILLDYGHSVSPEDVEGTTPLHTACKWERDSMCILLIENGANPFATDIRGATAISYAAPRLQEVILDASHRIGRVSRQRSQHPSPAEKNTKCVIA